jgi:hypothetical protein
MERTTDGTKLPVSDTRTMTIRYRRATVVELALKRKQTKVSNAIALPPSMKCAVERQNL